MKKVVLKATNLVQAIFFFFFCVQEYSSVYQMSEYKWLKFFIFKYQPLVLWHLVYQTVFPAHWKIFRSSFYIFF